MSHHLTAEVPAVTLLIGDVILADPDHPDTDVHWTVTAKDTEAGVRVVDYVTKDGTQGRHGFPDPLQWVKVAIRNHKTAPDQKRTAA